MTAKERKSAKYKEWYLKNKERLREIRNSPEKKKYQKDYYEKTKKKRGSYRGGEISMSSYSVKFDESD